MKNNKFLISHLSNFFQKCTEKLLQDDSKFEKLNFQFSMILSWKEGGGSS